MVYLSEQRAIGTTGILVSPVALGCWPISGMTSVDVNEADSLATIAACVDIGVNFLDTAFCYGPNGESERLIARAIGTRRDEFVIATKGGIHWDNAGQRVADARPERLRQECDTSLQRLNTDHVDLLYLHAPDPQVPLAESAGALHDLLRAGKTRAIGLSNANVTQLADFAAHCPLAAYQPKYNMLQREIEAAELPWCRERRISVFVYWPLMKGLLAGQMARDHRFLAGDGRVKYPMFRGEEWERNQDFVDRLREVAASTGRTVAQVVLKWTIQQPGITGALCGAKRPAQIIDNANLCGWDFTAEQQRAIQSAIDERGPIESRGAV